METKNLHSLSFFGFGNRKNWSKNQFAWGYASFILFLVVLFGFLLKLNGIYESVYLRIINIFFVLAGFALLIWDFKRTKKLKLTYVSAFKLCVRTGFYFWILFLPVLLLFLTNDPTELDLVKANETFGSEISVLEMVFWNYVEIVGATLVTGMLASYMAGFGKTSSERPH